MDSEVEGGEGASADMSRGRDFASTGFGPGGFGPGASDSDEVGKKKHKKS